MVPSGNKLEYRAFQDGRIVGGHHTDAVHAVPAGPAAAGNARSHRVVRSEEICLEPFSCAGYMSETRRGGGRGKKKRRHSTAQPRTVALKVFRVFMLTILEDIATGSTTLNHGKVFYLGGCSPFPVLGSGQDASVTDAYMRELHTRQ